MSLTEKDKELVNSIDSSLQQLNKITLSKDIDWNVVEQRFQKEYFRRIMQNNQMNFWEISNWFKNELSR